MTVAVKKRDADKVLAAIRRQFAGWIEPGQPEQGPKLVKDFDWYGGAPYAIVWEEGPYEWTFTAGEGGIDEEMTSLAREFDPKAVVKTKAVKFPDTVFVEPVTGWALGIYAA